VSIGRSVASEHPFEPIAFPVVGSGSEGFDEESVLAVMLGKLESSTFEGSLVIVRYRSDKAA
jgi:hypothetical protein